MCYVSGAPVLHIRHAERVPGYFGAGLCKTAARISREKI